MPDYRFYPIKIDGHISGPALNFDVADDDAAVKEASKLLDGNDIEIWQGTRLVAYVVPDQKQRQCG
jgi:hypothetical protein